VIQSVRVAPPTNTTSSSRSSRAVAASSSRSTLTAVIYRAAAEQVCSEAPDSSVAESERVDQREVFAE
jgi:hypothetical protein